MTVFASFSFLSFFIMHVIGSIHFAKFRFLSICNVSDNPMNFLPSLLAVSWYSAIPIVNKDNDLFSQLQRAHSLEFTVDIEFPWILPLLGYNSHNLIRTVLTLNIFHISASLTDSILFRLVKYMNSKPKKAQKM